MKVEFDVETSDWIVTLIGDEELFVAGSLAAVAGHPIRVKSSGDGEFVYRANSEDQPIYLNHRFGRPTNGSV